MAFVVFCRKSLNSFVMLAVISMVLSLELLDRCGW